MIFMALYFGNNKVKLNLDGKKYHLDLITTLPNEITLVTIDNKFLSDINCLKLVSKWPTVDLISLNNEILVDSDNLKLVLKQPSYLELQSKQEEKLKDLNGYYLAVKI